VNSDNFIACTQSKQIQVIFEHINNLITSMFDCLHGRNFKVNENIKNESTAVFSEKVLVYSWLSCPNTELDGWKCFCTNQLALI